MINAERLLMSMVREAMGGGKGRRHGRRRRGGGLLEAATSPLGMGALGVAVAAFEHFTQKPSGGVSRLSHNLDRAVHHPYQQGPLRRHFRRCRMWRRPLVRFRRYP